MSSHNSVSNSLRRLSILSIAAVALTYGATRWGTAGHVPATAAAFPEAAVDVRVASSSSEQTAVFAGGCFWGMEGVFEHLKGVSEVVSGYAGGNAESAHYDEVSSGATSHAESVKITYDPAQISYGELLKVYFAVAHDPTQLNRQGPDRGTQYRSAIFFANNEQKQVTQAYIAQLEQAQIFDHPIVTQLTPLDSFYAAEDYHQDFITRNPYNPYVVVHDLPQIAQLQAQFPELYQEPESLS
ncbi:MAG: peptide-methionine (S)-S-oxide reductase MsrA [Leptolyngbyaceae cyanobacterium SM1_1_3]|nr:peptide-methionine (S)-S-oxide reductase MsrA [Leptolyngbyaceae cyanobacterium SM1_1_3]NJN00993.1 peptide-methionine (S)-S-oxide reductase MsrA [Leptolyngbyaceae cyanobacterium RM1_1_2]NJO10708.1 peptide-methionine (S)-S-oxide reductase MsrA [Leptolyngbyaceae cyanobacterium SL_1_1]